MDSKTFERELSYDEVYARRLEVESLLDVQDELARKVSEHKFEIKKLQTADSAAGAQVRHLRWEIRTRRTYEPQPELPGIDGTRDESDEDTDPPPPDPYWGFHQNYPKAEKTADLMEALRLALGDADHMKLDWPTVKGWKPASGEFESVAHWARVENAHKSHATRKPTPGITLPVRFERPPALVGALFPDEPKEKPARKPAKKRRSGSTQHTS